MVQNSSKFCVKSNRQSTSAMAVNNMLNLKKSGNLSSKNLQGLAGRTKTGKLCSKKRQGVVKKRSLKNKLTAGRINEIERRLANHAGMKPTR